MTAISITRALSERKLLDAQIQKSVTLPFLGVQRGTDNLKAEVVGMAGKTRLLAMQIYQANFDRVTSQVKRRDEITAAVVLSNANTDVVIGGVTMKVAVAIERKKSIASEKLLLANVLSQSAFNQKLIDQSNATLETKIEAQITVLGGKEKGVINVDISDGVRGPMESAGKHLLIEPFEIGAWATAKMDKINTFETEVDFTLSESNAKTTIFNTVEAVVELAPQ